MNMKQTLFSLALLAISAGASANLVTNGDFTADGLISGGPVPSGWTYTGDSTFIGVDNGALGHSVAGANPYEYFSGSTGGTGDLSQSLSTVAGRLYSLNFDLLVDSSSNGTTTPAGVSSFSAVFGGNIVIPTITSTTADAYVHYSFSNLAVTGATLLEFISQNDIAYNFLTNVDVECTSNCTTPTPTPTPEPGSLGLMVLAAAAFRLTYRRQLS